jgi:mannose-6-phosphate isomerase-like protein (cupin superfamily)
MKEIRIQELAPGVVPGISIALPGDEPYREAYFERTAAPLTQRFKTAEISGGTLVSYKSVPLFKEVETHVDAEIFYFLEGTAIMIFADLKAGRPDMGSVKIVRIRPGTRIIIPEGKAHFVPVAEDPTPVSVVVVAPKMDAPRPFLHVLYPKNWRRVCGFGAESVTFEAFGASL